ncbi:MAG: ABC transporter ATP-binding protein [Streptococcaceae bacterium]|jgi:ABC-2 type transport system ATP-binding protein|nr:ABC transporter ATP-binding protein [Streptococcaceae bacterium]
MFEAKDINYTYPDGKFSIKNFQVTLDSNKVIGIVGRNGAGKTTMLNILTGFIRDFDGALLYNHQSFKRKNFIDLISYLPSDFELYEYLSLLDNLVFVCKLRKIDADQDYLKKKLSEIGLLDRANSKLQTLSVGMKQKFFFLVATLHHPKILVLDEPFTGLDPEQTVKYIFKLKKFVKNGGSIIFSSHILDFVSEISDSVLVIDDGKILQSVEKKNGTKEELREGLDLFFKSFSDE